MHAVYTDLPRNARRQDPDDLDARWVYSWLRRSDVGRGDALPVEWLAVLFFQYIPLRLLGLWRAQGIARIGAVLKDPLALLFASWRDVDWEGESHCDAIAELVS